MESRIDILNELMEISPVLAGIENVNVFSVPASYFNQVSENMMKLVKEQENSLPAGIKSPDMQVPAGYFDSLASSILTKIKAQEAEREYQVLNSISKENVYTVPQGYFETLTRQVVDKAVKPQAKVVHMGNRNTSWFKYAAAAVFIGIISLGVFKYMNTTNTNATAYTPDEATAKGWEIAKENKFDEELSKVTDDDIIKYLQKNNTDVDAALVANVVDENELPSKEDYLTDDKALDKYLDNIDLTDLKN